MPVDYEVEVSHCASCDHYFYSFHSPSRQTVIRSKSVVDTMKKSSNKVCDIASQGSQPVHPATRDMASQTSVIEDQQQTRFEHNKPPPHGCEKDKERFRVAKVSGLLLRLMADMFISSPLPGSAHHKSTTCRQKTNR